MVKAGSIRQLEMPREKEVFCGSASAGVDLRLSGATSAGTKLCAAPPLAQLDMLIAGFCTSLEPVRRLLVAHVSLPSLLTTTYDNRRHLRMSLLLGISLSSYEGSAVMCE
jgi:hypothetical protein